MIERFFLGFDVMYKIFGLEFIVFFSIRDVWVFINGCWL